MASNPPGACCAVGYKHEGTPTGTLIKLANTNIDAYLAVPPATAPARANAAIVFMPDILGLWHNNQLLADRFAAAGYLTLLPDVFNGDPFQLQQPWADIDPSDEPLGAWVTHGSDGNNPHTTAEIDPIAEAAIEYLKTQHGVTRIGAVGYCFGAKYVVRFMRGPGSINVGYAAHPSFVTEDELKAKKGPFSIAAAETDLIFPVEKRYRSEEILREQGDVYNISLYSGVAHGFAVRGDLSNPLDRWAEEEAHAQAVRFFDRWLVE